MRFLVTGGAGFIGSHIVRTLLEQGGHVRVLDNFSTGKHENLPDSVGALEVIAGDLRDAAVLAQAVQGIDVIFHQAAFVSVPQSMAEPQECFDINIVGTSRLLDAARKAGVRRAVMASSAAVYGDSGQLPLDEDADLRPLSPYALSKHVNEMYSQLFTHSLGLEAVALRYFNVYGPRQRPDSPYAAAVPIFINCMLENRPVNIFGDGGQTRDLINVRDVVQANLLAATHPDAPGQVLNVCTGIETRLLDLLEVLCELFPEVQQPLFQGPRAGDVYRSVGSPLKAASLIGFQAQIPLADGLQEMVDWMRR